VSPLSRSKDSGSFPNHATVSVTRYKPLVPRSVPPPCVFRRIQVVISKFPFRFGACSATAESNPFPNRTVTPQKRLQKLRRQIAKASAPDGGLWHGACRLSFRFIAEASRNCIFNFCTRILEFFYCFFAELLQSKITSSHDLAGNPAGGPLALPPTSLPTGMLRRHTAQRTPFVEEGPRQAETVQRPFCWSNASRRRLTLERRSQIAAETPARPLPAPGKHRRPSPSRYSAHYPHATTPLSPSPRSRLDKGL